MAKRGASGLSLLIAVDKPQGMSSHDVVNRCRKVFGERRVGHTGTLDPFATGVLPICVGPATRLDRFMTAHDKSYGVTVSFGYETDTDDSEGEPTVSGPITGKLLDEDFARDYLAGLVGVHEQVPPQYSAISVNGERAYKLARAGETVGLEPRSIEIYESAFRDCFYDGTTGLACWSFDVSVSKGTYIRALARDIGRALECPAHVSALRRRVAGSIRLEECVSLDTLDDLGVDAALDPVAVLEMRYAFADDVARAIESGAAVAGDAVRLNEPLSLSGKDDACACVGSVVGSGRAPYEGELACMVVENRLKAIYAYSSRRDEWKPSCVFSIGVIRG